MTALSHINPRIANDVRGLLPAFGLTLLGSLLVCPFLGSDAESWSMMLFSFGCVYMGVEAFGNDMQHGTLSLLLSQPISRSLLWKEKMLVLGIALFLLSIPVGTSVSSSSLLILAVPVCSFLTAPFWTLVARHTVTAIVLTFAIPGVLMGVTSSVCHYYEVSNRTGETFAAVLLAVYSVGCYWAAYRKFQNLELAGPSILTRELSTPARLEAAFTNVFARVRGKGFTWALVEKEVRLQQITFIAFLLFWATAAIGVMAHLTQATLSDGLKVSEIIWSLDFYLYFFILPLMAGATAVAEEKSWRVAEWQMTLPPSRFQQWLVKTLVALGISLLFGLALPIVAWSICEFGQGSLAASAIPALITSNLLLTSVALYAGSVSSTSARGVIMAVAMFAIAAFGIGAFLQFAEGLSPIVRVIEALHPLRAFAADMYVPALCAGMLLLSVLSLRFAYTAYRSHLGLRHRVLHFAALVLVGGLIYLVITPAL